ncbi:hypothetical protein X73_01607 [Pasteurella multocida subsp. gallicida X73]|nr:hypothetical protein X73_01607 [Pasteurella multocida subsp. gallicida X73]
MMWCYFIVFFFVKKGFIIFNKQDRFICLVFMPLLSMNYIIS